MSGHRSPPERDDRPPDVDPDSDPPYGNIETLIDLDPTGLAHLLDAVARFSNDQDLTAVVDTLEGARPIRTPPGVRLGAVRPVPPDVERDDRPGSVTLTHPTAGPSIANLSSGQWHERPGDPDRDLVERWAPLIAARLGGRGCRVPWRGAGPMLPSC